ncbi:MAG: cell wall-binding repeat-containing protein [Actinobacteria bacterium]|nr:cell wall-binding repeat-containing protein [Actinomycetota bacterium]
MGVTFFVVPHPDDEFSAWTLVTRVERPVLLLMTQGERSVRCAEHGGIGSQACKDQRVASWHQFLDATDYVARDDRLVFDLGDQRATAEGVSSAIRSAATTFGDPDVVVAAGYFNEAEPGHIYTHPDHRAVHEAVAAGPWPAWGRTGPRLAQATFHLADHDDYMRCPDGHFQRAYRWLRPPCWPEDGAGTGLQQTQHFWRTQMARPTLRIAGASRIDTAVAISRHAFPTGAQQVFLARADTAADAIAAAPLAQRGPILLVWPDQPLPPVVRDEIRRLAPQLVVALGGPGAVPQRLLDEAANA